MVLCEYEEKTNQGIEIYFDRLIQGALGKILTRLPEVRFTEEERQFFDHLRKAKQKRCDDIYYHYREIYLNNKLKQIREEIDR